MSSSLTSSSSGECGGGGGGSDSDGSTVPSSPTSRSSSVIVVAGGEASHDGNGHTAAGPAMLGALHMAASRGVGREGASSGGGERRSTLHVLIDEASLYAVNTSGEEEENISRRRDVKHKQGGGDVSEREGIVVTGLGMLTSPSHTHGARRIEVLTPYVSVEGVRQRTAATAAAEEPQQRNHHHHAGEDEREGVRDEAWQTRSATVPQWLQPFSRHIAEELLGLSSSTAQAADSGDSTAKPSAVRYHEVVTVAMGAASTGKTSVLLGSLFARDDPAVEKGIGAAATSNLLSSVLEQVHHLSPASRCELAVSLLEVRDAEPLSSLSAVLRATEAVDLLSKSGRVDTFYPPHHPASSPPLSRRRKEARDAHPATSRTETGCFMSGASDLPAARYVYCSSPAEVYAVLADGLSRATTTWASHRGTGVRHCERVAGREEGRGDERRLLRPQTQAGSCTAAGKAKQGHILLTLVVCASASHRCVGVWKLWDLAGPNATAVSASRSATIIRSDDSGQGGRGDEVGVVEFATRTHLGLVALLSPKRRNAAAAAVARQDDDVKQMVRADPACRLVQGSLRRTATQFTFIGITAQDAEMEAVNEGVLRSCPAVAPAPAPPPLPRSSSLLSPPSRQRRAQRENAAAALRILERFAIDACEFLGHGVMPTPVVVPDLPQKKKKQPQGAARAVSLTDRRAPRVKEEKEERDHRKDASKQSGTLETDTQLMSHDLSTTGPLSINVTSIAPDGEEEEGAAGDDDDGNDMSRLLHLPKERANLAGSPHNRPQSPTGGAAAAVEGVHNPTALRDQGRGRAPTGSSPLTPPSLPRTQRPSFSDKRRSLRRLHSGHDKTHSHAGRYDSEDEAEEEVQNAKVNTELFPHERRRGEALSMSPWTTPLARLQASFRARLRGTLHAHNTAANKDGNTHGKPRREEEGESGEAAVTMLARLAAVMESDTDEQAAERNPAPPSCSQACELEREESLVELFTETIQSFVTDAELLAEENARLREEVAALRRTHASRAAATPSCPAMTPPPPPTSLPLSAAAAAMTSRGREARAAALLARAFRTTTTTTTTTSPSSSSANPSQGLALASAATPTDSVKGQNAGRRSHGHSPIAAGSASAGREEAKARGQYVVLQSTNPRGGARHALTTSQGHAPASSSTFSSVMPSPVSRGAFFSAHTPATPTTPVTAAAATAAAIVPRGSGAEGTGGAASPAELPASFGYPALREAALAVQNCVLQQYHEDMSGNGSSSPREKSFRNGERNLLDALRQLQDAANAADMELRAAAEREREYLNMIL